MALGVFKVPKFVAITNPRLNAVYFLLLSVSVILNIWRFMSTMQYTEKTPVAVNLRVEVDEPALWSAWLTSQREADICDESFAFNRAGLRFSVNSHRCISMCGWGHYMEDDCLHPLESYEQSSSEELAVVTARQELSLNPPVAGGDSRGDSSQVDVAFDYVNSAGNVVLTFHYDWEVQGPPSNPLQMTPEPTTGNMQTATTVILGASGSEERTIEPGDPVRVTVAEVLKYSTIEMAELRGQEFVDVDMLSQNLAEMSMQQGRVGTLPSEVQRFGAELKASVACYSSQMDLVQEQTWDPEGEASYDTLHPVCFMSFNLVRVPSVISASIVARAEGSPSFRESFGIKVRCQKGFGYFRYANIDAVFVNLTSVLVFLALPRWIMLMFCQYCLGHLSAIYRGVINERFSISGCCGPIATRLMAFSVPFDELADTMHPSTGDVHGISREMMEERLKEVLISRTGQLDEEEIANFVHFCFGEVIDHRQVTMWNRGLHKDKTGDVIDMDSFSVACSDREQVDLESIVKLFDRDRRPCFLEKFFVPKRLKREVQRHNVVTQRSAAQKKLTIEEVDPSRSLAPIPAPALESSSVEVKELPPRVQPKVDPVAGREQTPVPPAGHQKPPSAPMHQDSAAGKSLAQRKRQLLQDVEKNAQSRKQLEDMADHLTNFHARHGDQKDSVYSAIEGLDVKTAALTGEASKIHKMCEDFAVKLEAMESRAVQAETVANEWRLAYEQLADRLAAMESLLQDEATRSLLGIPSDSANAETGTGAAAANMTAEMGGGGPAVLTTSEPAAVAETTASADAQGASEDVEWPPELTRGSAKDDGRSNCSMLLCTGRSAHKKPGS